MIQCLAKSKVQKNQILKRTNQRTKKRFDFRNIQMFFFSSAPPGARTDPVNPGQPAE